MNKFQKVVGLALLAAMAVTGLAMAQGIPTGRLSGRVSDADGNGVPGVTVDVTSPALQGTRSIQTDINGDYLVVSLPPGEYSMTYTMDGFETQTRTSRLAASQAVQLDVNMSLAAVTETIEVTGEAVTVISKDNQNSTTVSQDILDELPGARTQLAAVALSPGAALTGPGGAVTISGAQSWENTFSINGVNVNDNIRGTPNALFIEDAIEETTTSTSGISAEFGRFSGGIINTVTKSGGNDFHGSLRDNLTNQNWNSENRFSPTPEDKIRPVYEGTIGGRIIRDKLWFFGAGRQLKTGVTATSNILNLPYSATNEQKRYEGKLTFSPTSNHRFTGSYIDITQEQLAPHGGLANYLVDLSGLATRSLPNTLLAGNYSGVLTPNFFVEAQYSERSFKFEPSGGSDPSFAGGTPIFDLNNGVIYNESLFCGICADGGDQRENKDYLAKANYFLSTKGAGSHDIVVGLDSFDDIRTSNNYQSSTNFIFDADNSLFINNVPYPVILSQLDGGGSYLAYYPILSTSLGTAFKTNSLFVNDRWRLNDNLSFNLGVRYDKNDGKDATGTKITKDDQLSPRLGVNWNPDGNGEWLLNASFGRYVAGISGAIANSGSSGGSPATLQWSYTGPSFNQPGQPLTTSEAALAAVQNWFTSIGGTTNQDLLQFVNIPGGGLVVGDGIGSTYADEITVGGVKNFGSKGSIRADIVYRTFGNFYVTKRDTSTGRVINANGNSVDLGIIQNDDSNLERNYLGLQTSFNFRASDRLTVGGGYTLSHADGNFEGESAGSGPVTSILESYPEYKEARWNAPKGDLLIDQRHKIALFAIWEAFKSDRQRLALSIRELYNSGFAYSAIGTVGTRAFVTNPGYASPPSTVPYFFSDRGAFKTDDISSTAIGINYSYFLGQVELFGQFDIQNVFNQDGEINVNQSVITRTSDTSLAAFNPFTTTPVEGVNWRKGPNFGKALSVNDLQAPRTYVASLGIRF
ncbi:MAG: TonB-dependent receptor [Thermoanaerobaculia bacterium]